MSRLYSDWVGRSETQEDLADPGPYGRLAALLDHELWPWAPGEVPALGHWLNFLPRARQSDLGEDGHPRRGGFLPPVDLPRRMWAGGRLEFLSPIAIGAELVRRSLICGVDEKTGRSGRMVFVRLRHEVFANGVLARREDQDIVYREPPPPGSAGASPAEAAAEPEGGVLARLTPDESLLFRYSALTFNAHRIHYDAPYATGVEGYRGLLVHGPLTATLMLDAFERAHPGQAIASFSFRAERPLFAGEDLVIAQTAREEASGSLEARGPDGLAAVRARIGLLASP